MLEALGGPERASTELLEVLPRHVVGGADGDDVGRVRAVWLTPLLVELGGRIDSYPARLHSVNQHARRGAR